MYTSEKVIEYCYWYKERKPSYITLFKFLAGFGGGLKCYINFEPIF